MSKPVLEGVRVIDWTQWQAGPYAGALLADLGAEVIHVEQPVVGDAFRGAKKTAGGIPAVLPGGRHVAFEYLNRNKRGIAINLRTAEGREIMYRLVRKSDVLITNFRPVEDMSYSKLCQLNPRLIYGVITGLGSVGPESRAPAFEPIGFARSGMMWTAGEEGMPPVYPPFASGDRTAGILLCLGVLGALYERERSGMGQYLTTSLLGSLVAVNMHPLIAYLLTGHAARRPRRSEVVNPLLNTYQCKDGSWIVLSMDPSQRYWPTFCQALGRPELEKDPRFSDGEKRAENRAELIRILDEVFVSRAYGEWEAILRGEGELIFAKVAEIPEVVSDRQVLLNDYIVDWNHPELGNVKMSGFPISFGRTPPVGMRDPAPHLGQHTEEVMTELLDYSWEDIQKLSELGAI